MLFYSFKMTEKICSIRSFCSGVMEPVSLKLSLPHQLQIFPTMMSLIQGLLLFLLFYFEVIFDPLTELFSQHFCHIGQWYLSSIARKYKPLISDYSLYLTKHFSKPKLMVNFRYGYMILFDNHSSFFHVQVECFSNNPRTLMHLKFLHLQQV